MPVDQSEILKEAVTKLLGDAALTALLGGADRIFNHVPQDFADPYVVVLWQADLDWDTKDSTGYDGTLSHEAVSNHHGDRDVLKIADRIRAIYNESPIILTSGRIVCFDYLSGTVAVQVLETHHAIAAFNVLVDSEGVGGAPIPPASGGLIVVQDEGVDLPDTPHKTLNFTGLGVTASDIDGDEAEISIPGGGIGSHAPTHIFDAVDPIDGDRLEIDYVPGNYARDASAAGAGNVKHLTAHLAGIDDALVVNALIFGG